MQEQDTRDSQIEYRAIEGEPGYRVGNDGSVWSCLQRVYLVGNGRRGVSYQPCGDWVLLLQNQNRDDGYLEVQIRGKHRLVHRLVLEAFVGPCPDGMECCHDDGNPSNNRLDNLRWDTKRNNQNDRLRHGTHIRGERNRIAKLTDAQAEEVRQMSREGMTIMQIVNTTGFNRNTVGRIVNGKAYRPVEVLA
jgi:hypothetical protein